MATIVCNKSYIIIKYNLYNFIVTLKILYLCRVSILPSSDCEIFVMVNVQAARRYYIYLMRVEPDAGMGLNWMFLVHKTVSYHFYILNECRTVSNAQDMSICVVWVEF